MPFSQEQFLFTWLPVGILFLPLVAAIILLVSHRYWKKAADVFAIGTMGICFLMSVTLFACTIKSGGANLLGWQTAQANPFVTSIEWMRIGDVVLTMGFLVDNLSAFMCIIVTGLATLVMLYSTFYMHGDAMYRRYFMFMCFFCFAMLGIVLSNNLLMTFVFWELVGLGSYFLIGFWYQKPAVSNDHHYQDLKATYATGIDERFLSPRHAQKKAFVMNRIGDFGFLGGMMIFVTVMLAGATQANGYSHGPLDFGNLYAATSSGFFDNIQIWGLSGTELLTLAGILTFMGAMGKSAQFPLHTWLPDAMQGPTTGSSIIHAATMVAAGVYMTARIHPMLTDGSLFFVAIIGGITAFLAASMAMVQWDLKAVLAYSTISQLGYMMIALGAGAYSAGIAHLYTHAVFKCMLFLCAGSVIHATHHLQDMNKMGGLAKKMPLTWLATLAGVLAISGVPFFSGFYSKDAILAGSLARALEMGSMHWIPYVLGQVTALMTAFYMFRLLFWTFHGKPRDQKVYDQAHESPAIATVPLMILATLCLGFWWSGTLVAHYVPVPGLTMHVDQVEEVADGKLEIVKGHKGWLDAVMVSPVALSPKEQIAPAHAAHTLTHIHLHHTAHKWASILSIAGLIFAVIAAWLLYAKQVVDRAAILKRSRLIRAPYELASQLWFFDRLYQDGVVPLSKRFNKLCFDFDFKILDQTVIDGWAHVVRAISELCSAIDTYFVDRCVDFFGWVTWVAGAVTRTLQTGKIQYYVCVTFGVVAVLLMFLLMQP